MNSFSFDLPYVESRLLFSEFNNIDCFLEHIKVQMDVDSTQLDTGKIRISSRLIILGDIKLVRYHTSKSIFERYSLHQGHTMFAFGPRPEETTCTWCGIQVPGDCFAVLRPGKEYSCYNPAGFDIVEVVVPDSWPLLESMAAASRWLKEGVPEKSVFPLPNQQAFRFRELLRNLFGDRYLLETLVHDLELAGLLREWVLEELTLIMEKVLPLAEADRSLNSSSRYDIVRSAVQLIDERLHKPLSTTMLARELATSPRVLQYAFRETCSTTPLRYILHRKLQAARAELKGSPSGTSSQVIQAALLYGLNHPGRFSRDYKALFGESPSVTLEQNRAGHG